MARAMNVVYYDSLIISMLLSKNLKVSHMPLKHRTATFPLPPDHMPHVGVCRQALLEEEMFLKYSHRFMVNIWSLPEVKLVKLQVNAPHKKNLSQ